MAPVHIKGISLTVRPTTIQHILFEYFELFSYFGAMFFKVPQGGRVQEGEYHLRYWAHVTKSWWICSLLLLWWLGFIDSIARQWSLSTAEASEVYTYTLISWRVIHVYGLDGSISPRKFWGKSPHEEMILKSLPSSVEPLLRQVHMGLAMIGITSGFLKQEPQRYNKKWLLYNFFSLAACSIGFVLVHGFLSVFCDFSCDQL